MSVPRILIIDDDVENLALLKEALISRYQVETTSNPREGLSLALAKRPDLLIVDVDMPQMSGFEVCEALRASPSHHGISVIFLTSDAQADSMQRALRAGANDYLVKPFRLQEMITRIEFRLGQAKMGAPLQTGNMKLDPANLTVTLDTRGKRETVKLTELSFRVLEMLVKNEGRLLTREQIMDQCWGDREASDRAVDLQIFRLRKQIAAWDHDIESVYGRGYTVSPRAAKRKKA